MAQVVGCPVMVPPAKGWGAEKACGATPCPICGQCTQHCLEHDLMDGLKPGFTMTEHRFLGPVAYQAVLRQRRLLRQKEEGAEVTA